MSDTTNNMKAAGDIGTAAFKRRFIIRLVSVLTGGMILDGYILGIIGPVSAQMKGDLGLTTAEMSMVAAAALFGILFEEPGVFRTGLSGYFTLRGVVCAIPTPPRSGFCNPARSGA